MKRRKEKLDRTRVLRLWTLSEATKAAPYLHSVIGSLRGPVTHVGQESRSHTRLVGTTCSRTFSRAPCAARCFAAEALTDSS